MRPTLRVSEQLIGSAWRPFYWADGGTRYLINSEDGDAGTRRGNHVTEVAGHSRHSLRPLTLLLNKEPADVTLARRANSSQFSQGTSSPIVTLATACLAGPRAPRRG